MTKGTYIYKPNTIYYWNNHELDSMDNFLKANKGDYGRVVKEFFAIPEVQKIVDTQEWGKLFKEWDEGTYRPGEYTHFTGDVLGAFLWLLGIDFMEDLEDDFVKDCFNKDNYVNRATGKGYRAYKE